MSNDTMWDLKRDIATITGTEDFKHNGNKLFLYYCALDTDMIKIISERYPYFDFEFIANDNFGFDVIIKRKIKVI
jgi:hypothetical protein